MTKQMTKKDYERLLLASENELWAMTERHGRLANYVRDRLWPRARMTMGADLRAEFAEELGEFGCEVDA